MSNHAYDAVTGNLHFAADRGQAAWLHFVRADVANAAIENVDVSEAESWPGVLGIYQADDLVLPLYGQIDQIARKYWQPPLASDVVRYAGERIVAIVAESQSIALDAAERVHVSYDSRPPVLDPTRSPLTFTATEQLGSDDPTTGPTAELFARNQRLAIAPLEGVTALAEPIEQGRTRLNIGTQMPAATHSDICSALGLDLNDLELVSIPAGGAFGGKTTGGSPDLTVLVSVSRLLKRAVRYIEPRQVNLATMQGRDQFQQITLRAGADGMLSSLDLDVLCNAGAYAGTGTIEPAKTALLASGPYIVRSVHTHTRSVQTNTAPTGAYRGPGRAEATAILERGMDLLASELGIDAIELRRRNLLRTFDFPYKTPSGAVYDEADHRATLDAALSLVGFDAARNAQARLRAASSSRCIGVGVATWVDATAGWEAEQQSCASLDRDGTIRIVGGGASTGQGHEQMLENLIHEIVGTKVNVALDRPTSSQPVVSTGSFGSRTGQIVGSATLGAVTELHRKILALAAEQLEASPDDIEQAGLDFFVRGVPAITVDWFAIARAAHDDVDEALAPGLWSIGSFDQDDRTYPSGCHAAVVEVDAETGQVTLLRLATATDCGTVLHHASARDQARGAMVQGAAQALYEEVAYDNDGNLLTSSLADYGMPSAADVPALDVRFVPTPTDRNPLGAKGLAETGMLGAPPAVQNAVVDAISHLGVRHVDMPCTPVRVWQAIQDASDD